MNEVKKLYRNAGIEPTYYDACTVEDNYWKNEELANKYGTFDMYMNAKCGKQEDCTTLCRCAYTREEYPPFTAEKQLELIKWLAQNKGINIGYANHAYIVCSDCLSGRFQEDFEKSLAIFFNYFWQSLTGQEKEQIRDILKG